MGERTWSGLRETYTFEMLDGTTVGPITSGMPEVIRWERLHKQPYLQRGTYPSIEQTLWVGWAAGRRLGLIAEKLFDDFFVKVADYSLDSDTETGDDDEVGPTQTDPSPG